MVVRAASNLNVQNEQHLLTIAVPGSARPRPHTARGMWVWFAYGAVGRRDA